MEKERVVLNEAEAEAEEDPSSSTLLDLTSYQLHDLDSVHLPLTLTELDLTTNRLSTLDPRIGHLSLLNKLSLRQNLFNDDAVSPLSSWTLLSALEELVLRDNQLRKIPDVSIFKKLLVFDVSFNEKWDRLYGLNDATIMELVLRDNQLRKIPDVSIFKKLLVFDVSFNEITSLHGLSSVSNTLKELYVSKNEVAKIEEIDHFDQLNILELGSNKLRVMENFQNLTNLQELWLGRNRIKVVNLCGLKCIKKLSLQSNRLTSMTGFEGCIALEELYLSHNGISKMEGLSSLVNLRVLDVSSNKLTSVNDIQNLAQLEDLWLNDNQIESLEGIAEAVAASKEKLTTIYLEKNPCAKSPNYTAVLREIFPNIQQIDSYVFS